VETWPFTGLSILCKEMVKPEFQDFIKLPGTQTDIESIVSILDVGVLSTFTEGMSNSIMEYMALGKPVVATDGGGTNELVVQNETGFLVEQGNVEEMTDRIKYLLDNEEQAAAMGEAGRRRIVEEFGFENMMDRYVNLYRKCMEL